MPDLTSALSPAARKLALRRQRTRKTGRNSRRRSVAALPRLTGLRRSGRQARRMQARRAGFRGL